MGYPAKKIDYPPDRVAEKRIILQLQGTVQGVGFRPFIYRLANDLNLSGWVNNTPQGVRIEIEGSEVGLDEFLRRVYLEKPVAAIIHDCLTQYAEPVGYAGFVIRESERTSEKNACVVPDLSICPDCLAEMLNPDDRRYRYPFINCTNCGPRYSIVHSLPYDRENTTMKGFVMCKACRDEYEDPSDRRFHAQPNACPVCGPHLELWNKYGDVLGMHDDALVAAGQFIKNGGILALKGLGGFQILVNAGNDDAIRRLRRRKRRQAKPFAVMFSDLQSIKEYCEVTECEENLLLSAASPIVLLRRKAIDKGSYFGISPLVAPGNPYLGVILPYTPLHHLLMMELGFPVVATSGNLSDEPICIDEYEALSRLHNIADLFLVHNRPIARQVDDSIVREISGREMILRSARGYAPSAFMLRQSIRNTLAVGAHLKNSIAIGKKRQVFMSQHIGDLDTLKAYSAFGRAIQSLSDVYDFKPEKTVADCHPDYSSSGYVRKLKLPNTNIQHHYAHVLSCMIDNNLDNRVLGVSWDGTGLGTDNTIWGGEFLLVDKGRFERVAHMRTFPLPGNERAIIEPRRSAFGLMYKLFHSRILSDPGVVPLLKFTTDEGAILMNMLEKNINSPRTSSAGRLFDAVGSILDLCQKSEFEGQAGMALEFAVASFDTDEYYSFEIDTTRAPCVIDWAAMIMEIIGDVKNQISINKIAAKFHNTLVEMIISAANIIGEKNIVLTGGCFQNKYLLERSIARLQSESFTPYWHRRIPPNDGGICMGQIVATACSQGKE